MALDGIFLHLIKNEIADFAIGSKVEKVHQPSREELVLHLRSKGGMQKLLISVRANSPRIHFTSYAPENPATPPMFCMLMRKRLVNATLTDIRQLDLDRIIFLDFDATNEIGDKVKLTLCVEIMAKYSNIILLDSDGKIIDSLRRVDFSQSAVRQILPGFKYTFPPPQNKLNILSVGTSEILDRIKAYTNKTLSSAILNTLQGVSPLTSRELADESYDAQVSDISESTVVKVAEKIENLKIIVSNSCGTPYMLKDENGKPVDFSFLKYVNTAANTKANSKRAIQSFLTISITNVTGLTAQGKKVSTLLSLLIQPLRELQRKSAFNRLS
jgi:predicted ribosome quality control (RQC) complex YloA/Tae2 family protein